MWARCKRTTGSRRLGKLSERLADPARSGVYRVESREALEEAAALNRHPLQRIAVSGGIAAPIEAATGEGCGVLVLSAFETLFRERPWEGQALVAGLETAVRLRQRAGSSYFVVFLDPAGAVPHLPPLYKWSKNTRRMQIGEPQ